MENVDEEERIKEKIREYKKKRGMEEGEGLDERGKRRR